MQRSLLPFIASTFFVISQGWAIAVPKLDVWAVDPLIQVFPDTSPMTDEAVADVACGEHATLQVVVRCSILSKELKAKVAPFAQGGSGSEKVLNPLPPRFVGYVPVDMGTPKPSSDRLRTPPAFFPDPLLEKTEMTLMAGSAQAIWVTIPVPIDTTPGLYSSKIHISANVNGKAISAELPLSVRVWPVKVEKCRLWVTNWFQMGGFPKISKEGRREGKGEIKQGSDEYWNMLRRYARNMADHRQNVALISPLNLAEFKPLADGGFDIDFALFDRWVQIFTEEGVIGRI